MEVRKEEFLMRDACERTTLTVPTKWTQCADCGMYVKNEKMFCVNYGQGERLYVCLGCAKTTADAAYKVIEATYEFSDPHEYVRLIEAYMKLLRDELS